MVIKIQEKYELIRKFDFCEENKGQRTTDNRKFQLQWNGIESCKRRLIRDPNCMVLWVKDSKQN